MSGINHIKLENGVEVVWAVPLSGRGHVADEQPLPYMHHKGVELTPRFGGEEYSRNSSLASLPLPYGKINGDWPLAQRIFNWPRRRINIYWRNIFNSITSKDGMFYFIDQLNYKPTASGFIGSSPILKFIRNFYVKGENRIAVIDEIYFFRDIHFSEFLFCIWAEFEFNSGERMCKIQPSVEYNFTYPIYASTGRAIMRSKKVFDQRFKAGDKVICSYEYEVKE